MPGRGDRHDLREALLRLPGVAEGVGYGTPAFRIGKTMLARLRDDGVLVLKVEPITRDVLLATEPAAYFLEDHYRGYPLVLVHLAAAEPALLTDLLDQAWRRTAPKRLLAAHPPLPSPRT